MPDKEPSSPSTGPSPGCRPGDPVPCPLEPEYHLHVDADRDGRVDDDHRGIGSWTWGIAGKGAIILANCDDEDGTHNPDNEDNKINNAPDPGDIAPLEIRRVAGKPVAPGSWTGFLEVDPADQPRIRIFDSRAAGAPEIIGPATTHSYQLPTLGFQTREFGMEAAVYPGAGFSGEIAITFRIVEPAGTHSESAMVRVAPWVQFNHWDPTEETYVVETADNADFRADLAREVTGAGFPAPRTTSNSDRWMQDVMEIGYSSMPKPGAPATWSTPVVLRTANDRMRIPEWASDLDRYPKSVLLGQNYGFVQALPPMIGSSLDSFGNLECSPPFTHTVRGKEYKFGRIVYGADAARPLRNVQPEVVDFLTAQTVQEPFSIDTGWLVVGHVDEVVSFCPMKNAPKGFKVLLASPDSAMRILRGLQAAGRGTAGLFRSSNVVPAGIRFGPGYTLANRRADYPFDTANLILGDAAFVQVQTDTQALIDGIKVTLSTELDLNPTDFIDIPVLFKEDGPGLYVAYNPGSVNMLHLTKGDHTVRVCVPRPFGPVNDNVDRFARDILDSLGPAATTGVEVKFIDDFVTYHVLYGEIHCGTNSKRKPRTDAWWWHHQP